MKGVNLHEHCPVNDHYVTRDVIKKDIEVMQLHNINAIRASHYPHSPDLYRLADEYGMYVVNEANIETHGMGAENQGWFNRDVHPAYLPEWRDAHMDRIIRMVEREHVVLNVDLLQRGVGGDDSWGRHPHNEYRLMDNRYNYSFVIKAVRP